MSSENSEKLQQIKLKSVVCIDVKTINTLLNKTEEQIVLGHTTYFFKNNFPLSEVINFNNIDINYDYLEIFEYSPHTVLQRKTNQNNAFYQISQTEFMIEAKLDCETSGTIVIYDS